VLNVALSSKVAMKSGACGGGESHNFFGYERLNEEIVVQESADGGEIVEVALGEALDSSRADDKFALGLRWVGEVDDAVGVVGGG
jgi:hypothetical protein